MRIKSILDLSMDYSNEVPLILNFQNFSNMEIDDKLTVLSIVITIVVALIPLLYKIFRLLYNIFKNVKEWRDKEIRKLKATDSAGLELVSRSKYFIPIHGQLEAPHNTDEIFVSDNRFLLTKKFINQYLNSKVTSKKRYIILGGSGMGKSTFSADLFYQYINKYNQRNIPFPIYILKLGDSDVLDKIVELSKKEDACESILILDALDENVDAAKDINSFKKKIEIVTNIFKFVIITGRTQLFQDEISEPDEGIINQGGSGEKRLKWERIYVSPFSEYEIQTYLANKFTVGTENYRKAIQIVNKGNDLMSRPMILSFIDDLLGFAQCERLTIVEIYKTIIDKWLVRECKSQEDSDNRLNVNDLYIFSKRLAVYMYDKWETTGISHITKSEYEYFIESNGYSGNPYSFRGRSLINRKSDGSIKFSHKSFWEFFIALDVLENPGKSYNPDNLDMAKKFTDELNELYIQGYKLDNIEYYECDYTRYTKEEIKNLRNYIESLEQEIAQTEDITLLFNLWNKTEGYIINILLNGDGIQQCFNQNSTHELMSAVNNAFYKINARMFVNKVQECLYKNDINWKNHIDTIKQILINIEKHIKENINSEILFPLYKKQKVIFPNLFVYNKMVDNTLLNDLICIGSGFYDNQSIHNLIVKILTVNPDINLMNVVKNCTSLEDATAFVSELTEKIKSCGLKKRCNIVVSFNINEAEFVYLLNTNNEYSQINTCISKMYNLKSSKITS